MRRSLQTQESGERPERSGRSHRRRALAAIAIVTIAACARQTGAQGGASSEYQVKAAFLYHFAQFVEWPPEAFKDADSPVTYCTVGDDPFQGALDSSLNGKALGARRFRVWHLKQAEQAEGCHVLFIGGRDKKSIPSTLASVEGKATLTVGETDGFAQDGGMIGFCLEDNKIRFEINLGAAQRAKLKISARLLALARKVIGDPKGD